MPDFNYIETLAKRVFNNEIAFDVALEEAKALNIRMCDNIRKSALTIKNHAYLVGR